MTWTTGKTAFVVVVSLAAVLTSCRVEDQVPTAGGEAPLRTTFGHPDLQGVWALQTLTPLQRPTEFAGRATLTEEEAAKIEEDAARDLHKEITLADAVANRKLEREGVMPSTSGSTSAAASRAIGGYNKVWFDTATSVTKTRQTSLLIDPPDGRMPPLTPAGQKKRVELLAAMEIPAGPEDRSLPERCIKGSGQGPPMMPGGYNKNIQIFQTPDHVVIHQEMIHEARIIPLDGRPHHSLRQWRGTARGRWEGDTLVVETRNYVGQGAIQFSFSLVGNPDENLVTVERFTRVDATTIRYEVTINDPTVWTTPWTISYDIEKKEGLESLLFEFACHEGNAGAGGVPPTMVNMLISAREREKAGARVPTP